MCTTEFSRSGIVCGSVVSVAGQVSSDVLPAFADTQVHIGRRSICFRVAKPVWIYPMQCTC